MNAARCKVVIAVGLMLGVGAALGQSGPGLVERLVADLGSPDLIKRDLAVKALVEYDDITLGELEAALRSDALSPEQRLRLGVAAEVRFRATPRAAIGIRLAPGGVPIVQSAEPGFDSANKLRPDDTILSIAGQPTRSLEELRTVVIGHDPGETVVMRLDRGGAEIERRVMLGAFADLGEVRFSPSELSAAWASRLARSGVADRGPAPIPAPVTPEAWGPGPDEDEVARAGIDVVVGGIAREAAGGGSEFIIDRDMGTDRTEREQLLRVAINSRLARLTDEMVRVQRAKTMQEGGLRRQDLSEQRRAALLRAVEANTRELERLRAEVRRFEAAAGPSIGVRRPG